jgi:gluconate 2-dehydrogenase
LKPNVVIYKEVPQEVVEHIQESCNIIFHESLNDPQSPLFLKAFSRAHAIMGGGVVKVDKQLLDQAPDLKIVSNISVGYNNLDIDELTARGIMATNTPDVLNDTTADLIFGLLMSSARRIAELDQYVKKGNWKSMADEVLFGVDIHHKKLGIIGMGRIGSAIAKRAHLGFGMEILYHNRSNNAEAENLYNAIKCSLDELLQQSDFVCLMVPLTNETENLMGSREFNLMKKDAIFINGSRGATVDERALVEALQTGQIRAAGLDVFRQEPVDPNHPLLTLENAVTLPHVGSATAETRKKMAFLAAENLVKGLNGENPPSLINKELRK